MARKKKKTLHEPTGVTIYMGEAQKAAFDEIVNRLIDEQIQKKRKTGKSYLTEAKINFSKYHK